MRGQSLYSKVKIGENDLKTFYKFVSRLMERKACKYKIRQVSRDSKCIY